MNFLADVIRNMQASDQTTDVFNPRQIGLYIGLQLEEMAEKLEAILGQGHHFVISLRCKSQAFRGGSYDSLIEVADRKELLDADIDFLVVTLGSAVSQGADVDLAWAKVDHANASKINPATGKMTKDETGKWIKPAGWSAPDLSDCVAA